MGKTAILAIRIIGDATDAVTALDKVDGSAKSMQASMDKASIGAGVALGALAAAAHELGDAASEAQQAAGAVESVFKDYAGGVAEFAEKAADAVGLSEQQYNSMASVLGSQLKNMGVALSDTGTQTNDLVELGADLSAMFGGTTADAVGALSSLLRGERDPIERYGVSINQAAIDAEKAAQGLTGLTGEAEKNANLQATLALLTRQTADAQGQFGRESETAAGQQQRANAEWANASATLGEQLLPYMTEGSKILGKLAKWTGENTELVTGFAIGIGVLASGILIINGAMKVYAAVQALQTAAQWANNAAWLSSPITWIIIAIVAAIALVIAIVVLLIQHWDEVMKGAEVAWTYVMSIVHSVGVGFEAVFLAIGAWWDGLVASWNAGIDGFIALIRNALDWLGKLIDGAVPSWVTDLLGMGGESFGVTFAGAPPASPAFAAPALARSLAAPTTVTALSTTVPAASAASARRSTPSVGDTYVTNNNTTVNGAIDPDGTARTIRDVQRSHQGRTGRDDSRFRR